MHIWFFYYSFNWLSPHLIEYFSYQGKCAVILHNYCKYGFMSLYDAWRRHFLLQFWTFESIQDSLKQSSTNVALFITIHGGLIWNKRKTSFSFMLSFIYCLLNFCFSKWLNYFICIWTPEFLPISWQNEFVKWTWPTDKTWTLQNYGSSKKTAASVRCQHCCQRQPASEMLRSQKSHSELK